MSTRPTSKSRKRRAPPASRLTSTGLSTFGRAPRSSSSLKVTAKLADTGSSIPAAVVPVPALASLTGTLTGLMRPIGVRFALSEPYAESESSDGSRPRGTGGGRPPIALERSGGRDDRARCSTLEEIEKARQASAAAAALSGGSDEGEATCSRRSDDRANAVLDIAFDRPYLANIKDEKSVSGTLVYPALC